MNRVRKEETKVVDFLLCKNDNNRREKNDNKNEVYDFEDNGIMKERGDKEMDSDKYFERLSQEFKEREERINKNNEMMEKRITEERRLSEERLDKKFEQVVEQLSKTNEKIDRQIDKIESKIDSTNKWIIGLCISTILGIAAMVIAIYLK